MIDELINTFERTLKFMEQSVADLSEQQMVQQPAGAPRHWKRIGRCIRITYVLLWPSWAGALWASLWLVITHLMVRGEEEHLERTFGDEYRDYCKRTHRYFGLPGS